MAARRPCSFATDVTDDGHLAGRRRRRGPRDLPAPLRRHEPAVHQDHPGGGAQWRDHLISAFVPVAAVPHHELLIGVEGPAGLDPLPLVGVADRSGEDRLERLHRLALVGHRRRVALPALGQPVQLPLAEVDEDDAERDDEDHQKGPAQPRVVALRQASAALVTLGGSVAPAGTRRGRGRLLQGGAPAHCDADQESGQRGRRPLDLVCGVPGQIEHRFDRCVVQVRPGPQTTGQSVLPARSVQLHRGREDDVMGRRDPQVPGAPRGGTSPPPVGSTPSRWKSRWRSG